MTHSCSDHQGFEVSLSRKKESVISSLPVRVLECVSRLMRFQDQNQLQAPGPGDLKAKCTEAFSRAGGAVHIGAWWTHLVSPSGLFQATSFSTQFHCPGSPSACGEDTVFGVLEANGRR